MEVLNCTLCLHPCHCKGVGQYINTNQCIGYDCECRTCTHPKEEEKKMLKKIWKKIKSWFWVK